MECPFCTELTEKIDGFRGRCGHCLALYRVLDRQDDGCYTLKWWRWPLEWWTPLKIIEAVTP